MGLVGSALLILAPTVAHTQQADLEQRFKQLDRDDDGKLSAQELRAPQIFGQMDADGDGFVTLEEARGYLRAQRASGLAEELRELGVGPVNRSASTAFTGLQFTRDYEPGTRDAQGEWMGGTETLRLLAHDGKLFASLGYWTDTPYGQPKGDEPWTGAQILVKEGAGAPWRVDAGFGPEYLRVEGMISATFTTDASGQPLGEPVTLLVAGPSSRQESVAWTRDDATGQWSKTDALSARGGIRSFCTHVDAETGIHHLFAGLSRGYIVRGAYDPESPGRLVFAPEPELSGTGRVMTMVEANGVLYAACGIDSDEEQSGGLFRRLDGPDPRWELVWRWPYKLVEDKDESEIMRGLTAVPDPLGGDHEVIIGTCAYPGVVYRVDPAKDHEAMRELDIRQYFAEAWGVDFLPGPCLSAYNRMVPAADPETGERVHLIGVWVTHPDGADAELRRSAWYLVRHADGTYAHGRVYDPDFPEPNPPAGLVATRTMEVAPWDAREIYAGGYDGAANNRKNHNTAWIYRGLLPASKEARP
jgi:hypothetical protein